MSGLDITPLNRRMEFDFDINTEKINMASSREEVVAIIALLLDKRLPMHVLTIERKHFIYQLYDSILKELGQ